ncbi:prefoldin subunit 6 isoform X1 [Ammospiza nelsoni]|uniref:prefoldin subunit 6 isoform X1 n=1 Tax=Ammospiza nelsoni TaxID=2857394 RepID=UPI00286B5A36|nr:prefoldin subunit 6 isoform X1 [Ammospiza nelsoni]
MAEPLQKKLQGELEKYQQLQKELGRAVAARQKLETQLTENNIVQEELNLLDDSTTIFKLLGPVLVKQDLEEAKNTVGKRLEYISGEMWEALRAADAGAGAALGAAARAPGPPPAGAPGQALTPPKFWGPPPKIFWDHPKNPEPPQS